MLRVTLALLTVGITLYAFIDCLRCSDDEVRRWPRHVWCLITLIPLVGGLAWLVYGGRAENWDRPVSRPSAPDDDPEFLRSLDRQLDDRPRDVTEGKNPKSTGTSGDETAERPSAGPDPAQERPDKNPPPTP